MSSRTQTPVRNVYNHHRLQHQLQQCHPSLRGFLMPSNSTDFNQILNIASSLLLQTAQNIIKDTSPSQECPLSSSTLATTAAMSLILNRVLDAFKLNWFKTNFKQSYLRPSPEKTAIFKGLFDAFKLNRFEPNFKISFLLTLKLSFWMSNLKFSQLVLYLMFDQLFDWRLDPQFDWLSVNWLGNVQPNFIDTFEISLKSFPKLSKFHLINSSKKYTWTGTPQG